MSFRGLLYKKGKVLLDKHNAKVDELAKEKVLNQERKNRKDKRREMWDYVEQLRQEKMRAERAAWKEQRKIMIEKRKGN